MKVFQTKTYVMVTQKNHLNDLNVMVLLSAQTHV